MTDNTHLTKRVKRGRRMSRNVLIMLAALLVCSGVVRMGGGVGLARAVESADVAMPANVKAESPMTTSVVPETGPGDLEQIFQVLRLREEALVAAEQKLEERETEFEMRTQKRAEQLRQAELQVSESLKKLEAMEQELKGLVVTVDTASRDDIDRLTTVYENMKPKQAAALFDQMAPNFSAGFLAQMRPDKAAAVLSGMSPEKAYSVSVVLAGRNAQASNP